MEKSIQKFNKLIDAKEREKQSILTHYHHLQARFEEAGNALYELMQKEEKANAQLEVSIQEGDISNIQQQTQFIQRLEPLIQQQEAIYKQSRDDLHIEKLKLTQKNVEMKKFEKVKERKLEALSQLEKIQESKDMDEVSMNQFIKSQVMA